ncbi:hypothetical protein [Kutzneria chonburiensis]|uniref:Uncharacterized protein n=1 Tax=Kutzneria chonburiensis TaxID=1483604 RepID=A0ABV6MHV0_9PSEU|nr:hypothetical protein [Kutzneria chonburiensis]
MTAGPEQRPLSTREHRILRLVEQGRINALTAGFMFFRADPDGGNAEMLSPLDRRTVCDLFDGYLLMVDGMRRCREGTARFIATRVALTADGKNLLHHNESSHESA